MRVLVVHSFYRDAEPSGENALVEGHVNALRRAGNDVALVSRRTDELHRAKSYSFSRAAIVASGLGPSPLSEIEKFRPDVVHVHNLFPNFGRKWAEQVTTPLVLTLHNYRPLCAAATLLRDGHICTRCPDGDRWAGLRFGCYRDSRTRTLPLSVANRKGPGADAVIRSAAAIVVLSERACRVFRDAGVAEDKLVIVPNFVAPELVARHPHSPGGEAWLYAGRLSPEKGIDLLVERWPSNVPLQIVGHGPLEHQVRQAAAGKAIAFLGARDRHEVLGLMRTSRGLVFPSRWYEGFPMVYVEALASGLPVLGFDPSAVADFVRADGTGVAVSWADDIATVLNRCGDAFAELRATCKAVFEARYTEQAFVERMTRIYTSVLSTFAALT